MSAGRVTAIRSRDNPLLRRWRRLIDDPAGYRRAGEIWIEGEHLCAAYLARAGSIGWQAVISDSGWAVPRLRALADRATAVVVLPDALLAQLSTLESPAALCGVVPWQGAGELDPHTASVVLDRLQDPGNVGNILRSAAAFGLTQIVALKGTVALWSPKVLRAGMGAHFGLRLVEAIGADALPALRVPLIATSSHAAATLAEAWLPWPCAWVLGNEGKGVDAALLRACTTVLRIPQPGGEESLNVAAAAAVCFYESARRRRAGVAPRPTP